MNRKGFTLVELIATLVVLGIVVGITIVSIDGIFSSAKKKSEDAFVATIKDAMEMYLNDSYSKGLHYSQYENYCLDKTTELVKLYVSTIYFSNVITSEFSPITQDDLVNPALDKNDPNYECNEAETIEVNIYKDDDYVYYYGIDKSEFGCLTGEGMITNLPENKVVCN